VRCSSCSSISQPRYLEGREERRDVKERRWRDGKDSRKREEIEGRTEERLGNVGDERRWSKRRMKVRRRGDRVC
jgi:hypothetical protein